MKILNMCEHFEFSEGKLSFVKSNENECKSLILLSYSRDNLPFEFLFDESTTYDEYEEFSAVKKQAICQIFLEWIDHFDFSNLDNLISLQVCECSSLEYLQLHLCKSLKYFAASELFSEQLINLHILECLQLNGVAISLENVQLPDISLQEFVYYDIGFIMEEDRYNSIIFDLEDPLVAKAILDEELWPNYLKFYDCNKLVRQRIVGEKVEKRRLIAKCYELDNLVRLESVLQQTREKENDTMLLRKQIRLFIE